MQAGKLTSETLVRECLARISRLDNTLHAFVVVFREQAINDAIRLDAERASGRIRSPLHGIPIAVKDLVDVEGCVTGFGSQHYSDTPATYTAPFLVRLQEAGMILLGKTHMVEFAFGGWGTNAVLGTPRNPRVTQTHYVSGGSSSGSAAAVAGQLVPAAIGSDTGGSVRIPAALCGVVGLKTTTGLINTQGVAPLSPTFDTLGPLTNWANDAQLIFAEMCRDAALQSGHAATVVRYCRRDTLEPLDVDMARAFDRSIAILQQLGLNLQPMLLPKSFPEYQADSGAIMAKEAFSALHILVENQNFKIDPHVRRRVMEGAAIDDTKYDELLKTRKAAILEFQRMLGRDELIVLPTTPLPSQPLRDVDESLSTMSRFTRIANYLDLCGISLPMGKTEAGLPLGLQLLARGEQEGMLLRVAGLVESALETS